MMVMPGQRSPTSKLARALIAGYQFHLKGADFQGEDGIAGYSDTHQYICTSFAFWNERDPFLKERLFGVTGHEGMIYSRSLI
jgi:hypothetical protein